LLDRFYISPKAFIHFLPAAIIALIFFMSRRSFLIDVTLDQDELFSWMLISGSWLDFFNIILRDSQQFLYFALVKIWQDILSTQSDYLVRMPSLIFASLTVGLTFHLMREIFSGLIAVVVAAFLVQNPVFGYFATYHRPYSLLCFLIIMIIFSVWRLIEGRQKEFYSNLFLIFTVLLLYTHYLGLIFSFSIIIIMLLLGIKLTVNTRKLAFLAIVMALYCLQLVYQFEHSLKLIEWTKGNGYFEFIGFAYLFKFAHRNPLAIATYFCLFLFLISLVKRDIQRNSPQNIFILFNFYSFLLGILIFFLLSLSQVSLLVDRYLLVFLIFLLAPISYSLSIICNRKDGEVFLAFLLLFISADRNKLFGHEERLNVKGFFKQLRDKKYFKNEDRILCLYDGPYVGVLTQYSKMSLKRDICSRHIGTGEFQQDVLDQGYDYVIRSLDFKSKEYNRQVFTIPGSSKVLYSSRDFIIYQTGR